MNSKILIDTNILVYAWDRNESEKQRKAIDTLRRFKSQLHLSTQNLSEFSAVMIRHQCELQWLSETIQMYKKMMKIIPLTDFEIVLAIRAVEQYKLNYWDAQIWSVARSNGISSIFTEDGPIGQTIEGVTYINPLMG